MVDQGASQVKTTTTNYCSYILYNNKTCNIQYTRYSEIKIKLKLPGNNKPNSKEKPKKSNEFLRMI